MTDTYDPEFEAMVEAAARRLCQQRYVEKIDDNWWQFEDSARKALTAAGVPEMIAEVARHHVDFQKWEGMAARGAGQVEHVEELEAALRDVLKHNVYSADDAGPMAFGTGMMYAEILLRAAAKLPADVQVRLSGDQRALGRGVAFIPDEAVVKIDGDVDKLTMSMSSALADALEPMLLAVGCQMERLP